MSFRKIGLLLGDENDWPVAFSQLLQRVGGGVRYKGANYEIGVERMRIHPFSLRASTSYHLVIDRLAYWYFNPREWLKKAALLNDTYLINNPFTFQSMEKHSAYCAMIRAGLNVPETWLIPAKQGPEDPTFAKKYQVTASRYNDLFDLAKVAEHIGYPLYMKPFDGGGWRGVSRIANVKELVEQYDNSGRSMMHLQHSIEDFDVFVRSLAIGPQVMTMKYDPTKPQHGRYQIEHSFLSPTKGKEAHSIVKLINSFFRWEFNSCESILKDGILYPIDFANACPDIAVTSLHFYFPWAIKSLLSWSVFCAVSGRKFRLNMTPDQYWEVAESNRSYEEKLVAYEKIADDYFATEQFQEFLATAMPHLDEVAWEYFRSQEFDDLLVDTVKALFPPHEHDEFVAHYRGIMAFWAKCEGDVLGKNKKAEPEAKAEPKTVTVVSASSVKAPAKPTAKPAAKAQPAKKAAPAKKPTGKSKKK